jgi:hypothetical protein
MLAVVTFQPYAYEIMKQIIEASVAALTAATLFYFFQEVKEKWMR